MAKQVIGICDTYREYVESFAYYVWRKYEDKYDALAFTMKDALLKSITAEKIDILILTGAFDERLTEEERLCVKEHAGSVFVLSEEPNPYEVMCKYRSTEQILKRVIYEHEIDMRLAAADDGRMKKVAVYSPLKRCGKTSLSIALSRVLRHVGGVVFLTMEELCGHEGLQGVEIGSLSELLYDYTVSGNTKNRLDKGTGEILVRFGPAGHIEDLKDTTMEVWEGLIENIADQKGWQFLLVDIGDSVTDPMRLLKHFDRIYMPVLSDKVSQKKLALWEERFRALYPASIADRLRKFPMRAFDKDDPEEDEEEFEEELGELAGSLAMEEA